MGIAIIAAAALAMASPAPQLSDLGWLSGHWLTGAGPMPAGGPRWTEEFWTAANGPVMVGLSRSQAGFGRFFFEYMRIEEGDDGGLTFYGSPQGSPPVGFRLVRANGQEVVFENPAHDFPQRIAYRREADALIATISLIDGSRAQTWRYEPARPPAD